MAGRSKFGPSIFPLDPPRGREALERLGVVSGSAELTVEALSNHLSSWNGTSPNLPSAGRP